MKRICNYRNCKNDISDKNIQAKYCNVKCKGNESKYRQNKKKFLLKYKAKEEDKVKEYLKLKEIVQKG